MKEKTTFFYHFFSKFQQSSYSDPHSNSVYETCLNDANCLLTVQCCAPCEPHPPGPRNWQPRALTAAHRLAESCWGFWCCRMSSVTVRSPSERPARTARTRPSSSTSWQLTKVTSFLCMGRLSTLGLRVATPAGGDSAAVTGAQRRASLGI